MAHFTMSCLRLVWCSHLLCLAWSRTSSGTDWTTGGRANFVCDPQKGFQCWLGEHPLENKTERVSPIFADALFWVQLTAKEPSARALADSATLKSLRNKALGILDARAGVCPRPVTYVAWLTVSSPPDASTTSAWPFVATCKRVAKGPEREVRQFGLGEAAFCFSFIHKPQFVSFEYKGKLVPSSLRSSASEMR